ncbi:MAG: glycosyltransferase [Lentisphaerae bacterium]|nr:glycosyltransferase [Lentisphaerota bacterium]
MMSNKPLLSFLMICYNQELYVREALTSVLQQDLADEQLEIIVSDDCSQDKTYAIVQEVASSYHGPHRLILHRNDHNVGIGANFYQAYTLAQGDWLVMAAGDDISTPDRSRILHAAIQKYPAALGICTTREVIDATGKRWGYDAWRKELYGASTAWHRRVFAEYAPIPSSVAFEDALLTIRLFMLHGEAIYLSAPTVRYRVDGTSISSQGLGDAMQTQKKVLVVVEKLLRLLECVRRDYDVVSETLPPSLRDRWQAKFNAIDSALSSRRQQAELALLVMTRPFLANIAYLFSYQKTAGHHHLVERLGWLMRNDAAPLRALRTRFRPKNALYSAYLPNAPTFADEKMLVDDFLQGDFLINF